MDQVEKMVLIITMLVLMPKLMIGMEIQQDIMTLMVIGQPIQMDIHQQLIMKKNKKIIFMLIHIHLDTLQLLQVLECYYLKNIQVIQIKY